MFNGFETKMCHSNLDTRGCFLYEILIFFVNKINGNKHFYTFFVSIQLIKNKPELILKFILSYLYFDIGNLLKNIKFIK